MIKTALLVLAVMAQPVLAHADEQAAPASGDPRPEGPVDEKEDRGAGEGGDEILAPPPTYKGNDVTVTEKLGAKLAVDAKFRDQDGKVVTLGEVLHGADGELPTILTFNYSDCPMLCSLQLNGLTASLPQLSHKQDGALFRVGSQFRIVTIDLEPHESLERAREMRQKYIARLPEEQRENAAKGWTFLVAETKGDGAAIRRVAESVGFSYTYIKERAEWAHPAALIFVSPKGTVTRYVYGIEFDPQVMRESLFKAGSAEIASAIGFMNRCYHFDPDANNHARAGVLALRIGAAGFVVLLLSGLGVIHVLRKARTLTPSRGHRA